MLKRLSLLAALTAAYFVAAKLGLRLAFVHPSATAVWAPAGIALAAFLVLGYRVWPAVFIGAFLVNLTTAGSVASSGGIALGNTLEGLLGAYLVNRLANGPRAFERARDTVKLTLAAVLSTTVSATIGVTSLWLGGFARGAEYASIWWTWWLGDVVGDVVVAPALLLWAVDPRVRWSRFQLAEAAALLGGLVTVGLVVFAGLHPSAQKDYPLEFLCVPFLFWAAFRFGQREAATAVVVLAGIAVWGTLRGVGPFARDTANESLLLLQAFLGVKAVTILTLAAVVSERKQVEVRLRRLAISDPLTGLANYRQLTTVLEGEISRSQRTGRPFAVLLFDLDGLKKINDRHGHLVGSRALCRLADALRGSCRAIDTAARLGGDEFTLILPETEAAEARQVGARTAERLGQDGEKPALSVGVGVAEYPRDGATLELLLDAADRALYEVKRRSPRRVREPA